MTKLMSVQVRQADIRTSPSFLSKILRRVSYGDRLRTYPEKDSWVQVRFEQTQGWMHVSALSKKKIILDPSVEDAKKAADDDELALAGKGFNNEVESHYRERHTNLSYQWVDRAEQFELSEQDVLSFIQSGNLEPGGELK